MPFYASLRERATFATAPKRICVPSRVVLCFGRKKYYGHKFIIKRFTGGFIADHNVHRNNNIFGVAGLEIILFNTQIK